VLQAGGPPGFTDPRRGRLQRSPLMTYQRVARWVTDVCQQQTVSKVAGLSVRPLLHRLVRSGRMCA